MHEDTIKILGLIFGGGAAGSIVTGVIAGLFNRRKVLAEADGSIVTATTELLKIMQSDIETTRKRLASSEEKHSALREELDKSQNDLLKAESQAKDLKEIISLMEQREAKNLEIIKKLREALRQYDPKNPLLRSLEQMEKADNS